MQDSLVTLVAVGLFVGASVVSTLVTLVVPVARIAF